MKTDNDERESEKNDQKFQNISMKGHSQAIGGLVNQEDHDVGLPFSDVQKNDNSEVKMVCAHRDPQIKALKVKNIIAGKGGKETENVRNWPLDLQASEREKSMKMGKVPIKPKRVSWQVKFKKWFKRFKSGDKENEGEMNQTDHQVDLPFSSDVQNNDDNETKMEIHQRESQLKDQKLENIDERSDDKGTETHVTQPDNKVNFDGWPYFDSRNYDTAKGKIHSVQKNSQIKAIKVENLIMSGDEKAVVNIRKSPPVLQANEREMILKINDVKTKPKSVSLKIKLEKWFRRFKSEDKEFQGHISKSKHEDGSTSSDIKTNDDAELKINYGQTDTKMMIEKLEQIAMKGNDKDFEGCTIQPKYEVGLSSSDIQNNEAAERNMNYAQTDFQMVPEKLEKIPLKSDNKKSEGDICHTDYEVELQSSCMQGNNDAKKKMNYSQTDPQVITEKLENISEENDDRDTEENMSLLDYEVMLSYSHIHSNDDAKREMKNGQTHSQNIPIKCDDEEFEGSTIQQKYEVGISFSDVQNSEDAERNINYAPTDLQMVTEKLEKIFLKSDNKKSEGDICHTDYEVELQPSCMQGNDDAKKKMNYSQTDPQMITEELENISEENDDRDTEENMSLLDYEVMLSSSHIQSNDDAKRKMKNGQTDSQNIPIECDDEEFEGCTIQQKYEVRMSTSDIQNNEAAERNMNYAQTELQMVAEKLEKIPLKSDNKKSEGDICHTDYEVELQSSCMLGNDDAKKKMNYSQTDLQAIAEKLENIFEENDDRDTEENMSLLGYEVMLSYSHIQSNDDAKREMKYGQTDSQNIPIKCDDEEFEGCTIQHKYEVEMSFSDVRNSEDAERNINYAPTDLQMVTEELEKIPLKSESKKNVVAICHTDYIVELQSSCKQTNDDAKKKINYSQTDPQVITEKLENISEENDDRDTKENMSLLDYEVMLSYSHIHSNDDAKREMKYGQTHSQNIPIKCDDEEFEGSTIQQKYEVGISFSDVQNSEDAERNINYAPTDLQMVTEKLEKIFLKSDNKKSEGDICHIDYEVELQPSCMQGNDDAKKKMNYSQTDPQMITEELENISEENDDRDTEENMSLLDYEVMLSSSHIQSNDDAKRKMKNGQTDSQNIPIECDDEEFEGCTIQQKYEVRMSTSDIQNNEAAERNMNYAQTELQMVAEKLEKIPLKSDNKKSEGDICHTNYKVELQSSCMQGNDDAKKKMNYSQTDLQAIAEKLENISEENDDRDTEESMSLLGYEVMLSYSHIQSNDDAKRETKYGQTDSQNIPIKCDDEEFEGCTIQQKYEVEMSFSDVRNSEDAERNINYAPTDLQMVTEELEKIPLKSESKKNVVAICHTDYIVELQSSCMQRNDDAKKKMNYSQTNPQMKPEKLENITVENDDRDTEENMSLLDYEVMLSSSHIQSNDDAEGKIKYSQTDSQMMAEKYENITNKSDDEEFEECTIQQKYELGMSSSNVQNNEDAERNMNYTPTDLQMVTEKLEKIPLKSENEKNVVDICRTGYEVELQSSCLQRNDDAKKKMNCIQLDPQMKPEKFENITVENDDRDTEENMSLLDYEVMFSSSHVQSNDGAKRKMKYGQTGSQIMAEEYENITVKTDDEEFEGCTIQQKYEVGMAFSDIQNSGDAERNINYARTDLQMIAEEFKNITLKCENNEIEGNMRNPDHKAWLQSSDIQNNYADEKKMDSVQRDPQMKAPKLKNIAIKSFDEESELHTCKPENEFLFFGSPYSDIQSYNTTEEKIDLVQRDSQVKAQTVENIIKRDDGERNADVEPWTLNWQEAEQEINRKINEVPIKQKRVTWKTKLEKRFKR
ncbi:uncharacterized protein LOC129227967 [Uloborus diversus]|uniref:uncharacterized protein LOC129227967 n=1 Tax=Uloborus diversus TaxID=327109 RepID=UPI00240A6B7E|nr:uncharacterized protein LOC129227967 [Uloborus diversus]